MALMKSISGIRGTIGGEPGTGLTPPDIVKYTAAFAAMLQETSDTVTVVVGRDGRMSGEMVRGLVVQTLVAMGVHVIDLGLSTTPTVEMAVTYLKAQGGIILTASHNPREWNALKLLNASGEFMSASSGKILLEKADKGNFSFAPVDQLGTVTHRDDLLAYHIHRILQHPLVRHEAIEVSNFRIVIDPINSSGAIAVPALLDALGVRHYTLLNGDMHGNFVHNPEPLAENLTELSEAVMQQGAHLGIAVDPDVDRLVFMNEDGSLFGEEYTLVAVADYVLAQQPGNTVSNLSSSRALRDITRKHGGTYYASAVGEVHVVEKMKAVEAVIGGEGNGGIIDPKLHYGRDALIGIALFLSHLATSGKKASELRRELPTYAMSKNKIELQPGTNLTHLLQQLQQLYVHEETNTLDGLKIDFEAGWVHLRASNTEPIIRVYAEAATADAAAQLAHHVMQQVKEIQRSQK